MINLHNSNSQKLDEVPLEALKSYVKNYQTHVSGQTGQSPDEVAIATTIPHEVLKQLLNHPNSNAVRIYMGKKDKESEMTFMAVAAQTTPAGVTTDAIGSGVGMAFMLDPCPSNACPDGTDFVGNSSLAG